jgi:hypothetical protein
MTRFARSASRLMALTTLSFAAAAAFAQALPDGKIGINYNRCDNSYDGWGAHLWRNPNLPITGVDWGNPMKPTGKNDFGVYFHVDASEFGNSTTVNYILHKGDSKDQGGQDMKFDGKTTKEIWVNSGDRKIYTSLDDAKKARAENPCK